MNCAIGTLRVPTSGGNQVINFTDAVSGAGFDGKLFLFLSGSCAKNALYYNPTGLYNTATIEIGAHAVGIGAGIAASGDLPQFGVKIATGAGGPNDCVVGYEADSFLGGTIYKKAQLTAHSPGSFTLNWTIVDNWFEPSDVIYVVLGGSDLLLEVVSNAFVNGTHATTNTLVALLNLFAGSAGFSFSGSPSPAAGPASITAGWAVNGYDQASMCGQMSGTAAGGTNGRYQRTDTFGVGLDTNCAPVGGLPNISTWNANSIVTAGSSGTGTPGAGLGIAGVQARSGHFNAPTADGAYLLNTGIYPKFIWFASYGAAPSLTNLSDMMQMAWGYAAHNVQMGYWWGENSLNQPLNGAKYLSDASLLRFATPNAGSTVFSTLMTLNSIRSDGLVNLNFANTSGLGEQIIWFALGDVAVPITDNSGIYKMTPGKLHDTIYTSLSPVATKNVALDNPFAITGLIGDEP